jgi:hypothetical protein
MRPGSMVALYHLAPRLRNAFPVKSRHGSLFPVKFRSVKA